MASTIPGTISAVSSRYCRTRPRRYSASLASLAARSVKDSTCSNALGAEDSTSASVESLRPVSMFHTATSVRTESATRLYACIALPVFVARTPLVATTMRQSFGHPTRCTTRPGR